MGKGLVCWAEIALDNTCPAGRDDSGSATKKDVDLISSCPAVELLQACTSLWPRVQALNILNFPFCRGNAPLEGGRTSKIE